MQPVFASAGRKTGRTAREAAEDLRSASLFVRTSIKCRHRRMVGHGPRLYYRGLLLLASTPIKYTNAGPRLMWSAWSNFRPKAERAHSFGVA